MKFPFKEILVITWGVVVFTCWHGVTSQNTEHLLQNVPTASIQRVYITLKMRKRVHPKCLNPPYKAAPCHSHQNMSCFIVGTKNALYQNPATFIYSPCVSCRVSHCWVVSRITEVEYKWCRYIGRCGWAVTVNILRLSDFIGFCCVCGSGSLVWYYLQRVKLTYPVENF